MLSDHGLPTTFYGADKASIRGQAATLRHVGWSLTLAAVAATTSVFRWPSKWDSIDLLALISLGAFIGSILFTVRLRSERYQEQWYRGRAVAESVKSLAWRYAVGGYPFPIDLPSAQARYQLLEQMEGVVGRAGDIQLAAVAGDQITTEMSELREQDLGARREAYLTHRISDQEAWYVQRAIANDRSSRRWTTAALVASLGGVAGALLRLLELTGLDLMGVMAALAAGATAWAQLKQHSLLATSYSLTAHELSVARERLKTVGDEADWSTAVGDAEEAVSREHQMWLARRTAS